MSSWNGGQALSRWNGRRSAWAVAGLLAVVAVLLPSAQAVAADDPGPAKWPEVAKPDAGGNQSDPGPVKWAAINPPQNGSGNDPEPRKWPEVAKPSN